MRDARSTALATFFALVAGFFLHRGLSFEALAPVGPMDLAAALEALLVGCLSDIWVAYLATLK